MKVPSLFQDDAGPLINCIFFAEFDTHLGPKISFQSPAGYFDQAEFGCISTYVITKPMLCDKLITCTAFEQKIVGFPACIEDSKYHRNALLFNLCFVLPMRADVSLYAPLVQKLGRTLVTLEKENEFLFDEEKKAQLNTIIQELLIGLNRSREVHIPVDESNTIYLKLNPGVSHPPQIEDWLVPVPIIPLHTVSNKYWDLTLKQVIPMIDGVRHIRKISALLDISPDLVKKCVQHLMCYGYVALVDAFAFSNVYTATSKMVILSRNEQLQSECLSYVTHPGRHPAPFRMIFSLYCAFRRNVTVKDICLQRDLDRMNVDIRRLVTFGVLKGLLRRIHKFPIVSKFNTADHLLSVAGAGSSIKKLMDGSRHYDQLCCSLNVSPAELDAIIAPSQNHTVIVWK